MRYLRWGGDGEAVQPEKCLGLENCLRLPRISSVAHDVRRDLKVKLFLQGLASVFPEAYFALIH